MHAVPIKTKVILSDYPYLRDIENRLFLAQLGVREIFVLQEILDHSLRFSFDQLADATEIDRSELSDILEKLKATKLFKREGNTVIVDKDKRKYFELQIRKFDEDFQPGLDFFQSYLSQVPIHVLPGWFAISRSTDHIFSSITEKYFLTPKIFREYIEELEFDNPVLKSLVQDVYTAPDLRISSAALMKKYGFSREKFEESLLLLEYHFICCLRYVQKDGVWEGTVTPFSEWGHYLKLESKTIALQEGIQSLGENHFEFIDGLSEILESCRSERSLRSDLTKNQKKSIDKLLEIEFIRKNSTDDYFSITEQGRQWLSKPLNERAVDLSLNPLNRLSRHTELSSLFNTRNLRIIEKKIRGLPQKKWISLELFVANFPASLGGKEGVVLKNRGKKWGYELPVYGDREKLFITIVISERLRELGVIEIGASNEDRYFRLTPFGQQFIH